MSCITIEHVEAVVKSELPEIWAALEASLSLVGASKLSDVDHCIGLIIVGEPGGRKTTTTELIGNETPFYKENKFTPASFVSHYPGKNVNELAKVDLLPRIKHMILIIPELAPIFGQRQEDLINDISILTAVMDGKGYLSDSGVHGRRGYEGDYRFSMIAGTTPLKHSDWQVLGKLSSRWIFYDLGREVVKDVDVKVKCKASYRISGKDMLPQHGINRAMLKFGANY